MKSKDRLRKKYYSIRKKNYFHIKPNYFNSLITFIEKKYKKKYINVSIYYPFAFEIDILKLLETKIIRRMKVFLPVIKSSNLMNFYEWSKEDVLQINKFGMLEPIISKNHTIPDVMMVPLLAYDDKKNRLGYGKGFYDRYLKKYLKKYNDILTIGVAFSFQKYHNLPVSNNDIKLNYILTEKGNF